MSGTYHIEAGAEIESFQEAVDSLESQGVSDSVAVGIYLNGSNTDLIQEMEVINNQFIDIGYESMLFRRVYHGTIQNNEIQGGYIGIHYGTSYERARIQNNRIICRQKGINYYSAGYLSEPGLIANNYIFITDGGLGVYRSEGTVADWTLIHPFEPTLPSQ